MGILAFVDKKIKEGKFLDELAGVITEGSANWSIAKTFYKVAFDSSVIKPNANYTDKMKVQAVVSKHILLQNTNISNSYLGIAISGELSLTYEDFKTDALPTNSGLSEDQAAFATFVQGQVALLEPADENDHKMTKFYNPTTVYFYMCENLPTVADNAYIAFPFTLSILEKGSLDIEAWQGSWASFQVFDEETQRYKTQYNFEIKEPELGVLQSPISQCYFRSTELEDSYNETYNVYQNVTNWWYDSQVTVKGYIGDKALFLIMQSDTVPAWEDNIVPSIPLYFGELEPFNDSEGQPLDYHQVAFFAGTCPDADSLLNNPKYDFDNPDKSLFQTPVMPILKGYPRHPSNGINTVMLHRAKQGARYQQYFLSWNSAPNDILPDRSDTHETEFSGATFPRDYPRAWNQPGADESKYWFNPSRYSGKIHTSKIYVMHPEEGLVGALYNAIGLSSVGIMSGKIKVLIDPCAETNKYQYYRYFVVDGISPMTTRPGTVYRPMGLGILDDTPIV